MIRSGNVIKRTETAKSFHEHLIVLSLLLKEQHQTVAEYLCNADQTHAFVRFIERHNLKLLVFLCSTARRCDHGCLRNICASSEDSFYKMGEAGTAGGRIHGGRKRFRGGGPEIYSPQRSIREQGSSVESTIHPVPKAYRSARQLFRLPE